MPVESLGAMNPMGAVDPAEKIKLEGSIDPAASIEQMDASIDKAPAASIEGVNVSSAEAVPGGVLGKNEFLGLLIAQMQNQDPLEPMDNKETIAQLASFSALEQMQNVSEQVSEMRRESGLINSMLLKGKTVTAQLDWGEEITGVVDGVLWSESGVALTINGLNYSMDNMIGLSVAHAPVPVAVPADSSAL